MRDVNALNTNKMSQESFSNNLLLNKYKFHEQFKANVKKMLPQDVTGTNVSNIGIDYETLIVQFYQTF